MRARAKASRDATHSAARRMSAARAGSELTLGMATSSASARSEDGVAAIDREHLARHPRRLVGGEEEHAVRDVLRRAESPRRDRLEDLSLPVGVVALPLRN